MSLIEISLAFSADLMINEIVNTVLYDCSMCPATPELLESRKWIEETTTGTTCH